MRTLAVPESQARPASPAHPAPSSRQALALQIADLSQFTKALRQQLLAHQRAAPPDPAAPPGHQSLLNMLARAAGHRNLQALIARQASGVSAVEGRGETVLSAEPRQPGAWADVWADAATESLPGAEAPPANAPSLSPNAAKALTQFDRWGRLSRWPHKFSVQRLAMWVLWTRFEAGRTYREREVNDILKAWTLWGDHVTPRRELVEMGLLSRESDCSAYWKNPQQPSDEVRALLRALRSRPPAAAGVRSA